MQDFWAIGLMTGTALDGFADVALIKTDGIKIKELGEFCLVPYSNERRDILSKAVHEALIWQFKGDEPEIFAQAREVITEIYIDAIEYLISISKIKREDINYIGAHGLTVLHIPPHDGKKGKTLQLLDGHKIANATGIKCVWDFRNNDVMHGGQGAPLAPIYHAALLQYANIEAPAAMLNLGGVANLTYWNGGNDVAAFDCGPANGPINELVELNSLGTYDKDGALAAKGKVHQDIIDKVLSSEWFTAPYPKSLDRYDYSAKIVEGLDIYDGCATLSALVAQAISKGLDLFAERPKVLVAAGGGRKNPKLIEDIQRYANVKVVNADDINMRGDAVEAECFGFLAVRSALNLPISFPHTTGAKEPLTGGVISEPK